MKGILLFGYGMVIVLSILITLCFAFVFFRKDKETRNDYLSYGFAVVHEFFLLIVAPVFICLGFSLAKWNIFYTLHAIPWAIVVLTFFVINDMDSSEIDRIDEGFSDGEGQGNFNIKD